MPPEVKLPPGFQAKAFLRLAVPMIISRAGLAAMDIADGVMVGRYGSHDFAWLSLAEGTLGRILDICVAFMIGGLALVPRHFAQGDGDGARAIWLRTLPFCVGLGLVGSVAGLFGNQLLQLLRQGTELSAGAGPVMAILGAGYPAALLAIASAVYMEGLNRPQFVAASIVLANVLNVALNWILIGGHFGIGAMGARGSALSTTLVRCALGLALVSFAWFHRPQRAAESESSGKEQAESMRLQWRMGLGAAATVTALGILSSTLTVFAGWIGASSIATFSAAFNLGGPIALLGLGLGDAAGIYVAAEAGRAGISSGAKVAWRCLRVTLVPVTVLAVLLIAFASACAGIYTKEPGLRTAVTAVIPLAGLNVLTSCVAFVMISAQRAIKEVAWPMAIEIGSAAFMVPAALLLAFGRGHGVRGLFMAMLVLGVARAALLVWRFWWRTQEPADQVSAGQGEWGLDAK